MLPYHAAFRRAAELVRHLRAAGHAVRAVDCGGGLGIGYRDEPTPAPEALAAAIGRRSPGWTSSSRSSPAAGSPAPPACCSPPSSCVKRSGARRFVVLDAAMNDLLRPAMYDAWHGIVPVAAGRRGRPRLGRATSSGRSAKPGTRSRAAARCRTCVRNSRVAILDAGAYGSVMSSTYNARPLAAEVLVDGGRWSVIRDRQPVEALWARRDHPGLARVRQPG